MSFESENMNEVLENVQPSALEKDAQTKTEDEREEIQTREDISVNQTFIEDVFSRDEAKGVKALAGASVIADAMSGLR